MAAAPGVALSAELGTFGVASLRATGFGGVAPPASAIAWCVGPGGLPLFLTLADPCGCSAGAAALQLRGGRAGTVGVSLAASLRLRAAERAFEPLAARGWRCATAAEDPRPGDAPFLLHLWRPTEPLAAPPALALPPAAAGAAPRPWVGAPVRVVAAPVGAPSLAATQGVVANASAQPGLWLLDARCAEGSAGGAVVCGDVSPVRGGGVAALVAPLLQNRSAEAVALALAVPLATVAAALAGDQGGAGALSPEERRAAAALAAACAAAAAPPEPALERPLGNLGPPGAPAYWGHSPAAAAARRGVALLWLEPSGSWASAVVVSEDGYLITCAHLLTGRSWMEDLPEHGDDAARPPDLEDGEPTAATRAPTGPPRHPDTCRGRACLLDDAGVGHEREFEAEVIHVHNGFFDVALLRARPLRDRRRLRFAPLPWSASAAGLDGARVWAVGHGLFGPGTPWRGPTVTRGQVARVAFGAETRRAAVVQSTAAVHRGCSGGALVDVDRGSVVGLITTNVKQQDGAIMPHVNFSLPVDLLAPLRDACLAPGGGAAVGAFARSCVAGAADEHERGLWRLAPEPLHLPSAMEERLRAALQKMQDLVQNEEQLGAEASGGGGEASGETAGPPAGPPRSAL